MRLLKKLKRYGKKKIVAMHMPGHKRKNLTHSSLPYKIDITEIDDFDNLHNAQGILKYCQNKLTKLYQTSQSFYLVNGSTSGMLASIFSVLDYGDKIAIPQNCHKCVFHPIETLNLQPVFIPISLSQGIISDIKTHDIDNVLNNNPDLKCVLITSPTYDGVISDIVSISKVVHRHNATLIVDEAHGAHLFLDDKSAVNKGADIVINSLHKSLPALTQTAVLHVCHNKIDVDKVKHYISVFNTSSPSYVLMSSIDECVEFLLKKGKKYYEKLQKNLKKFVENTNKLKNIHILQNNGNFFDLDNTKIIIYGGNFTGHQLEKFLINNKIQVEMSNVWYTNCYTSLATSKADLKKLYKALKKLDKIFVYKKTDISLSIPKIKLKMPLCKAQQQNMQDLCLGDAVNKISGQYVWTYPPGIPIIVPGQLITTEIVDYLKYIKKFDIELVGMNNEKIYTIKLDNMEF